MRPRKLRTLSTWLRVSRRPDLAFVFEVGQAGEREPYRGFLYSTAELPTIEDAMSLAAAFVQAPPMLAVVSVPVSFVSGLVIPSPVDRAPHWLDRVRDCPIVRLAYQVPTKGREALRGLLAAAERRQGAHVDPFDEAEARNLAARLHRALGAV